MRWLENDNWYVLRGAGYAARIRKGNEYPRIHIGFDGCDIAEFPMVSMLDKLDEKEKLANITLDADRSDGDALTITLSADSNIWSGRRFVWRFEPERISYRQYAHGSGALGRCFFFGSGTPVPYGPGTSYGYTTNATFYVPRYHTFNPNLANITDFDISQPGFVGVGSSECVGRADYFNIERDNGLFSPAPLFMAFYREKSVMGIGIGAMPGEYRFNGLEYSGSMREGAEFHVQYLGYTSVEGEFAAPEVTLQFGYEPFECLRRYIAWIDENGYGTDFRFPEAPWHRQPIFCGWAEQTAMCPPDMVPSAMATQENYEKWTAEAERRGIPFGTVVIDDKWQQNYGAFDVDKEKWPDMPGFVRAQHAKGRRVVLWIPAYQTEGIPPEWCAHDNSKPDSLPLLALPGLPAYDAFIREGIIRLVRETDIDGFKEDWIGRTTNNPHLLNYGALHGIELVRRFQFVVHDALHAAKPDALLETQTPNPLFRESSDMLRLNDIWYATRDLPEMMRERARIARIAGWNVLDCDNASSTVIGEWFRYAQLQPEIGTPSLYFLTKTESAREHMTPSQSDYMAALWREYIDKNAL